jgi:hypothetical protein
MRWIVGRPGAAPTPARRRSLTTSPDPPVPAGIVVACPCGEVYELKPEYGGRLLECAVCRRHLRAGPPPGTPRAPAPEVDPAFDRDVFLLRERVLTIAAKYEVLSADGVPLLYVERPTYPVRTLLAYGLGAVSAMFVVGWTALLVASTGEAVGGLLALAGWGLALAAFVVVSLSARPRRHVTVYRDETRREVLLRILQDQRLALLTRSYTVVTAAGAGLARLRKLYVHNVLRKRWYVETPAGEPVAMAAEDSVVLSLLRRVLGAFFGILRTNFVLVHVGGPADGVVLGEFNRKFTILDRYVLDLAGDLERRLDRRVALALGIMLDSGERR